MEFESPKDISCYSTNLMISYARARRVPDETIFKGIEIHRPILENPLEWIEFETWDKLADNIKVVRADQPSPLFSIAVDITLENVSSFQLLFMKIAPLSLLCATLTKHFSRVNKNLALSFKINKTASRLVYTVRDRTKYSRNICEYNKGTAYAIHLIRGYKNISITEKKCLLEENGDACEHKVTFEPQRLLLQTLRAWFFFRFRFQKQIISHMQETHTSLQEKHHALKAIQEFYSHLMATMEEAVVWCDRNGAIRFTNVGFCRMTGIDEKKIIGNPFFNFVTVQGGDGKLLMSECLKNPLHPRAFGVEILFRKVNPRFGEASIMFVESGSRQPGFLIVIRDKTEQKKIERRLFVTENRYRALYENSPAIIIGLDRGGRFIYANRAMEEQSGYSEQELRTMHFTRLLAPGGNQFDLQEQLSRRMRMEKNVQEVHFKAKSGEWKCVSMNTFPLFDSSNNVAGLAGIGVDVTETHRLNEQIVKTQRMELLGQLAGGLAHDFNNILTSISGYSELIFMKSSDENSRKMADVIRTAVVRANTLIKKLLSFSSGDSEVSMSRMDVAPVVRELHTLVIGSTPGSIRVEFDVPEREFPIMGDAGGIHQVVLNLCVNARDALVEKNVADGLIRVKLYKPDDRETARIEVSDNGPGIPPHIIEKIFDPFFTTKKGKGGTGLGLSVVYGIVKSHNGEIQIDSRPGEGTTFIVDLPLVTVAEHARKAGKGIIMVLDDEPGIRALCTEVLRHYEYATVDFSTVDGAIQWLSAHPGEAWFALSDIFMPEMNPDTFIRQCGSIKDNFKVLWMSGYPIPDALQPTITESSFIRKPFTPFGLMERIKQFEADSATDSHEIERAAPVTEIQPVAS